MKIVKSAVKIVFWHRVISIAEMIWLWHISEESWNLAEYFQCAAEAQRNMVNKHYKKK